MVNQRDDGPSEHTEAAYRRQLEQALADAQRAVAWLLWQMPGRTATISALTMAEMPLDVQLASEMDPRGFDLRLSLLNAEGVAIGRRRITAQTSD